MKANEFVKRFGWDGAKRVIELTIGNSWADHYNIKEDSIGTAGTIYSKKLCEHNDNFVCLRNLKRLVESHELVESFGSVSQAKFWADMMDGSDSMQKRIDRVKQAILDVESCQ